MELYYKISVGTLESHSYGNPGCVILSFGPSIQLFGVLLLSPFPIHLSSHMTRFNKIATQGAPQMAVDKEANSLSRVYSYYSKFNLCLFYV